MTDQKSLYSFLERHCVYKKGYWFFLTQTNTKILYIASTITLHKIFDLVRVVEWTNTTMYSILQFNLEFQRSFKAL